MKSQFKEWYALSSDEIAALWKKCTFILDSNVLLGLYQYPPDTLNEFFKVLERIKPRLWLPYQAGLEFHRNRDKSLPHQRAVLEALQKRISEITDSLDKLGLPEYHPVLNLADVETARNKVKEAFETMGAPIRTALEGTPHFAVETILDGEPVRDRLTTLFDGRVGTGFTQQNLQKIFKEGADRYARDIPPGYKDRDKEEPTRYMDLVIWNEILVRMASLRKSERDCIFVTNDLKEDWWLRKKEALLGPRPELIREYTTRVEGSFHMYTPADFLKNARNYLRLDVPEGAIANVQKLSQASPVRTALRYQRVELPQLSVRLNALGALFDALSGGRISKVGDLNTEIESLAGPFGSSYVAVPLFFSLLSKAYGPLHVGDDPSIRLRDRAVRLADEAMTRDQFVASAHAAWLAQALNRLRNEAFRDEDLLVAFFGDNYPEDAPGWLRMAKEKASADASGRSSG